MLDALYVIGALIIFLGPFAWILVAGASEWWSRKIASARFKKALAGK